ncbi:NADP-dependent 3-hydroxy acid dehydrogenase YdfG [Chitinophaga sp. YR573]|uniref:SDR family NAD(P)-dependent oxidoreductase n=1 Tax=Chitinophaga sp. YR573 TaxID=1881040 RepID=UPI0008AC9468|nr:SDR family NAD(P)-dependent oxidoreductase [Chitinophaga sp. YR573]SEW02419.1 NADP-dependent 3-hydroxy acid dehydrogenase YdfG [Chitinophaga sp. YR573]
MNNKQVWYVTGASKGLGLALVKKLLSEGYRVAATSRNISSLAQAVGTAENFLPLEVDLGNDASVAASMKATHEKFGSIDVVVNNAGYGIGGAVEELSRKEVADSFDVNVFATITVMQKAMPYLRAQRSGHIMNIASVAAIAGAVGWAVYAAAKNAVIALSDVMAQDVKSLGIKVTAIAPGAFRTQFLSQESLALSENRIDDYVDVRASHARYLEMDGKQIGDPVKAAEAIIKLSLMPEPPVLLFLGSDAYTRASGKLNTMVEQLEQWKDISDSTQL